MIYVAYNQSTGAAATVAYGSQDMIPAGTPYIPVSADVWNEAQGKVLGVADGQLVATPRPTRTVRIISKYLLWTACKDRTIELDGATVNLWTAAEAAIAAAGLSTPFALIQQIRDDNPFFVAALPDIETRFGAALVAEVLTAATESTITEEATA